MKYYNIVLFLCFVERTKFRWIIWPCITPGFPGHRTSGILN